MDCTHSILNDTYIPKDYRGKAVSQIIQRLYIVLEECLNMEQVKLIAHPNGEYYDMYTSYHDLKKHAGIYNGTANP
jgi:hypothetical protein